MFIPRARLVWISCVGVPLRFSKSEYFFKLGYTFGKPLMVEEETVNKRRFDRGKVLLLITKNQSCPAEIKVSAGKGSFHVKINEDSTPVDCNWVASIFWD